MNYKDLPLVKKEILRETVGSVNTPVSEAAIEQSNDITSQNNALSTFMALDLSKTDDNKKDNSDKKDSSAQTTEQTDENDKNSVSDERCKKLFGENCGDLLDCISKLNSYIFEYNEKAKSIPDSENKGVDDDVHVGVLAQELAANPATAAAVEEDPLSGYLQVDTKELTMAEMAILTTMAKRIKALEEEVYGKVS